jgi:aminoacrylate peracid reductase
MPMTPIIPPGSPRPIAPYSPGTKADNVVYVAGTLALDSAGAPTYVGDAGGQTRQILEAIKSVIEAAGGSMADIAFTNIFIKDWSVYAAMNAVYADYFPGAKPARYCVQCGLVKPDCLVEIAAIAHLPS